MSRAVSDGRLGAAGLAGGDTLLTDELAARRWLQARPEMDDLAAERLDRLVALLAEENTTQNLVSAASLAEVWRRHIVDSAQLLRFVPRETPKREGAGSWLDLGTGAGFPGLVIAVLQPDREVLMVESRAKRIAWLERACAVLGLGRARVIGLPLEQVAERPAAVISARAFAPLGRLVTLSSRFSTSSTRWLLPKGRSAAQELQALTGWRHAFHVEHSLTDAESGIIVGELLGPSSDPRGEPGKLSRKSGVKR